MGLTSVWIVVVAFIVVIVKAQVVEPPIQTGRIVGGTQTTIQQYPYTAQVLGYYTQYNLWSLNCAGTILTRHHILSAAHCFTDQWADTRLINIRVGSTSSETGGTIRSVSLILAHASYSAFTRDNDIAVLLLSSAVTYSSSVQPGQIPAQGFEVPDNSPVVHVGWGATYVGGPGTTNLREVEIYTVNRTTCRARYAFLQNVTNIYFGVSENMICAGILDVGGRDACQGDSGGPLLLGSLLVGVTSWGQGCANATYPGVSARVSSYTNWINATLTQFPGSANTAALSHVLMLLALLSTLLFYTK